MGNVSTALGNSSTDGFVYFRASDCQLAIELVLVDGCGKTTPVTIRDGKLLQLNTLIASAIRRAHHA